MNSIRFTFFSVAFFFCSKRIKTKATKKKKKHVRSINSYCIVWTIEVGMCNVVNKINVDNIPLKRNILGSRAKYLCISRIHRIYIYTLKMYGKWTRERFFFFCSSLTHSFSRYPCVLLRRSIRIRIRCCEMQLIPVYLVYSLSFHLNQYENAFLVTGSTNEVIPFQME